MIHEREREREREGTGYNEESEGQMGWSLGGQKNPRDSRNSLPGSALGDHEAKVKTSNFCPYPYLCRWATLCPNQGIGDLNAISNTTPLSSCFLSPLLLSREPLFLCSARLYAPHILSVQIVLVGPTALCSKPLMWRPPNIKWCELDLVNLNWNVQWQVATVHNLHPKMPTSSTSVLERLSFIS